MAEKKKYRVFISSTYRDLAELRQELRELLTGTEFEPVGMESFLGAGISLPKYLEELIDDCNFYVVIVAGCYGTVPDGSKVSYTEMEYDYAARSRGLPILAFIEDGRRDYPDNLINFKSKIAGGDVTPTFWSDPAKLPGLVLKVLNMNRERNRRPCWVREDELPTDTAQRLREAQAELAELNAAYEALRAEKNTLAAEKRAWERQIQAMEDQITELEAQVTSLKKQLAEAKPGGYTPQSFKANAERKPRGHTLQNFALPPLPERGSVIPFGDYKWQVLDVDPTNRRALLLSENLLDRKRAYHNRYKGITWENCTLRKYLNGEFYNSFKEEDRRRIERVYLGNPDNTWGRTKGKPFGTPGGKTTDDHIFLLSVAEILKYYPSLKLHKGDSGNEWYCEADERLAAKFNGSAVWWWLRSPGSTQFNAASVNCGGNVGLYGNDVRNSSGGVRPALWLNL